MLTLTAGTTLLYLTLVAQPALTICNQNFAVIRATTGRPGTTRTS